ncbi:MAG: SUMF1/EgtB/PvdO family nonheme iron enzyme [Myxococcota bacterium]
MRTATLGWLVLGLGLGACTGNDAPREDAGPGLDAAGRWDVPWSVDATVADAALPRDAGWDGGGVDATTGTDAGARDATTPDAAGGDAGVVTFESCCETRGCQDSDGTATCAAYEPEHGRCAVDGNAGVCVSTSLCGGDWVSTAGLCPGPADIQCCAPPSPRDAGPATFETCCAEQGCDTDEGMEACAAFPSEHGECSVAGVAGVCASTSLCGGSWVSTAGYCPGPADIQCCHPPDDSPQCTEADHPLPNVGIVEESWDAACPAGMKLVDGFCVDVYEAVLVEMLPDGGVGDWSPYFNPGNRAMRAMSAAGAVPQGYINANQAEAACQNAGKRLCTDVEWLRACQGPDGRIYPYGNARQDGVCNDARSTHPAIEYFGPDDPDPFSKIGHPCLNQLANGLDVTGENAGCVTSEGLMDMMGNLHEWTADPAGTFRGGFYVDTRINGEGCLYRTTAHDRLHWDYSTGFRCCADPL